MADIYSSPNVSGSRRFQTYMNQYGATSGRIPSASMLDSIIQAELEVSSRRMEENRRFAENQRQFDISQENAEETAAANRKAGLIGTGMQAATTGAVLRGLTMKPGDPYFGETLSNLTGKGYNYAKNLIYPGADLGITGGSLGIAGETSLGTLTAADVGAVQAGNTIFPMTSAGAPTMGATGTPMGSTAMATYAPYLAPAAAGYIGGQLGQPIGKLFGVGGKRERGVAGGALAGAAIGSIVPGVGTLVGGLIGGVVGGFGGGIIKGIGKVFCFIAGTPITMLDGGIKPIEEIDLLDGCERGGLVTGKGVVLTDDLYDYEGVKVSGSHAVYEDGEWKRVENSLKAISCPVDEPVRVYIINNDDHILMINGITFADYGEVTDSEDMTMQERLDYLNENCRI